MLIIRPKKAPCHEPIGNAVTVRAAGPVLLWRRGLGPAGPGPQIHRV